MYMSNGLIGFKAGPAGDARLTPSNIGELYRSDYYADKAIQPLPNPLFLDLRVEGEAIFPTEATGYKQDLDMATGTLKTSWRQDAGGVTVDVLVELVVDRSSPSLAGVRYTLMTDTKAQVSAHILPFGRSINVKGTGNIQNSTLIWKGPGGPTSYLLETRGHEASFAWESIEDTWQVQAVRSTPIVVEHVVTFFESQKSSLAIGSKDFDAITRDSASRWADLWHGDIIIEGDVAAQQLVRSWLFNLYQSLGPGYLPPMGWSSNVYAGRIFWDQETWMLPALLPFDPSAVATAIEHREGTIWKALGRARERGFRGCMFPWESTPDGEEGAPEEFQKEIHIGGDIAYFLVLASAWGAKRPPISDLEPPQVALEVAAFYASRMSPDGSIRGVISPDEGSLVNNDLYTNALAKGSLQQTGNTAKATKVPLPIKDNLYLTYDGDTGGSYKQAAALLTIYPLDMPMTKDMRERMFDHYKDRVIDSGPAMSDAIHSIIACRLGRRDEAYRYFEKSYTGFVSKPGLQFSEKRKGTPKTYFLTGAGGCLQAVIYGFAGVTVLPSGTNQDWEGSRKTFTKPLPDGYRLLVRPCLPKAWTSLTLRGVHARGKVFTVKITHKGAHIDEGG